MSYFIEHFLKAKKVDVCKLTLVNQWYLFRIKWETTAYNFSLQYFYSFVSLIRDIKISDSVSDIPL